MKIKKNSLAFTICFFLRSRGSWKIHWTRQIQDERARLHQQQAEEQGQGLLHDEAQDQEEGQEVLQGEADGVAETFGQATKI